MHTLDIIFLVLGLIFLVIGIKRGLSGEIIRVLAMVLGFVFAFVYYNDIAAFFSDIKTPLQIKNAAAFVIIYIVVVLLVLILGWIIKKLINFTMLGWIDRILGGFIGLFKAALLAWAVCLSISSFHVKSIQTDFSQSIVYSTYKKLPDNLHLKALVKAKHSLRRFFQSDKESIDNKKEISESIKEKKHSGKINSQKHLENK